MIIFFKNIIIFKDVSIKKNYSSDCKIDFTKENLKISDNRKKLKSFIKNTLPNNIERSKFFNKPKTIISKIDLTEFYMELLRKLELMRFIINFSLINLENIEDEDLGF